MARDFAFLFILFLLSDTVAAGISAIILFRARNSGWLSRCFAWVLAAKVIDDVSGLIATFDQSLRSFHPTLWYLSWWAEGRAVRSVAIWVLALSLIGVVKEKKPSGARVKLVD